MQVQLHELHRASSGTICVARQPIFNARVDVVAYELLYRSKTGDTTATFLDGACATARVVVGSVAEIGLDTLSNGCDVHVNLPRELVVNPIELPLRPETTVLEILESVRSDAEVISGIQHFRERGFRIALDDYASDDHDELLVGLADIVKIDLLAEPEHLWPQTVSKLLDRGLDVVAEKVETYEHFEKCRAIGIQSFQGYWFQRPETFVASSVPANRLASMQVLSALHDPGIAIRTLAEVVQRDLSLVYRLLRLINSGYYNLPRAVTSVDDAILLLGIDNVRRFCALMSLAAFDDRPQELLISALIRGRMCELLSARTFPERGAELFLVGLLSHIDALLGVPASEAIRALPLGNDIEMALTAYAGPIGPVLKYVVDFERGRWPESNGGIDSHIAQKLYQHSVQWADEARGLLLA
jgi:EAL and modified HD-GYP domain-containing signal transduction protein